MSELSSMIAHLVESGKPAERKLQHGATIGVRYEGQTAIVYIQRTNATVDTKEAGVFAKHAREAGYRLKDRGVRSIEQQGFIGNFISRAEFEIIGKIKAKPVVEQGVLI